MKSTKKKLPLWKRVLRVAGIGLSVLVLAFAGLVAYAYWFYKEPMARSYYLSELPLTREQFADDFEEIHRTVAEHYSFYRQKGIDMDSLHRVYAGRVAQAQTTTDYGKLVMEYIAALQAGHASTPFAAYMVPDEPVVIHDSLFVSRPSDYLRQYGFRDKDLIVAIDGLPLSRWAEGQEKFISASTASDRRFRALQSAFDSRTDSLRRYTVWRDGDTLLFDLPLRRFGYFPKRQGKAVEVKVLRDSIGFMAINTMMSPVLEEFEAQYPKVRHLPYLIIDVRANGGGNSGNGRAICEHFIRHAQPHCVTPDGTMEPTADAYQGKLYLLTGPATFSAAESFTLDMKESGNVCVVGEPTAGDTGNRPRNFATSHEVWFRIPTRQPQKSPQGFPMEGVNIPPHHVVHQTVGDFMQDKDTQLAYVLGMIAGE